MKGYSVAQLESSRPDVTALQAITFCLEELYADKKRRLEDIVAGRCTYEELIGALIFARDGLERLDELEHGQ